ncbi:nuclear transport factor 2 family protein [Streptomyces sp. NPDC091371]|uniref:nuclear transport factor 2 family protein n=1 Tax=Streptomyces sp. NPDC091371 TaxID=3155303 RepID=UPI003421347F
MPRASYAIGAGDGNGNGLARRLQALEDKEALRALLIRGWRALDHKDSRAWSRCWADDSVLEFGPWGTIRGREAAHTARTAEPRCPLSSPVRASWFFWAIGQDLRMAGTV